MRNFMFAMLLAMLGAWPVYAETALNGPVSDNIVSIAVVGNKAVETGAILERMHTRIGEKINRKRISRDVRRLYATGFFKDIRVLGVVKADGRHLTVKVVENPVIASLKYVGLNEVAEKDLKKKMKLKVGHVFNAPELKKDITTIRKGYLKKGYYQVDVRPVRKVRKDGRINLTFKIDEGAVTRIKRIRFIGNKAFSDAELSNVIASKTGGISALFKDRDIFDRKRLDVDRQLLLQNYMNKGYLDAKVESTLLSLSPDKDWFYVTFSVLEGPKYQIASIKLQGDLVPDKETLRKLLELKAGDTYSLEKMRTSIEAITVRVGDDGYAFATVTPLFQRHPELKKVDVTLDIEKGAEVYVERIEISGNDQTEDNVIRREIRQMEGARFSSGKLEISKKRVKKLGYFEDVRVSMPRGSSPDKVDLKVKLDEKSTGSFRFGVGFSQLEKVFIRSTIQQNNLLGKGLATQLSGDLGTKTQNINASITDPYFIGENISSSLNIFKRQTRLQSLTSFKENSFGGGFSFGVPITEYLTYGIGYQYSETNLFGLPTTASFFLRSQEGRQTIGEFTQSLSLDTTDNYIAATSGSKLFVNFGIAGAGGVSRFITSLASARTYWEIADGVVFNPSIDIRYIRGYNARTVPIYRLYSLGGIGTVRGFDTVGITIRDPVTNEIIGGNKSATANMNLFFPLPYMQTSGIRGVTFVDIGDVADFNQTLSFSKSRVSAGLGIEWISPIGPLGLTWAFVLRDQPGDIRKKFEFALGSRF